VKKKRRSTFSFCTITISKRESGISRERLEIRSQKRAAEVLRESLSQNGSIIINYKVIKVIVFIVIAIIKNE